MDPASIDDRNYILTGTRHDAESARLAMLEDYFDPATVHRLERLHIAYGARCLEVGAGRGSITRWLSDRVGATGHVVAADIDCRFLTGLPGNVEVRETDVRYDELEPDSYDVVHCRALLNHVPDPVAVLRRMAAAVRPGGVLLAEEGDMGLFAYGGHPDAQWAGDRTQAAFGALASAKTMHGYLGRALPGMLADAGLGPVRAEVETSVARYLEPAYELWRTTWLEIAPGLTAASILTAGDCDRIRAVLDCPATVMTTLSTVAAWARRPVRS